jgi:hypothetical protein
VFFVSEIYKNLTNKTKKGEEGRRQKKPLPLPNKESGGDSTESAQ